MRVVKNLRVSTWRSRDISLQAKGIIGIESTQIRWFSQWSVGGGWSGRAVLSGAKSLKTKGQGTVRLPPQWATTEAARQGPEGQDNELLSRQLTERNKAMGKRQPAKESTKVHEKRKDAYSMLQSWTFSRGWCRRRWRCRWVRTTMASHRAVWQRNSVWF
jgi:hypothetical protein